MGDLKRGKLQRSRFQDVKKRQHVSCNVEFTPSEDVTKATSVVHGVLAGIPIPFPIDNPNGCVDSGLTCPVKSGSDVTYSTSLFVKSEYPNVRVTVEWELRDQNGDDVFCIKLPAQIASAPKQKNNNTKQMRDNSSKLYFKPRA